MERPLKKDRR